MAVLYRHIRLDTNQPFYIGIGKTEKRAYDKHQRNKHWHGIVNKHGYKVHIMLDDLTFEEAKQKEIEFIQLYGRADLGLGTLVNMTDGGEGTVGKVISEEYKAKLSAAAKGKVISEEWKAKLSAALKGKPNPKVAAALTGKVISAETKAKISARQKGKSKKPHSAETKAKLSAALKGKPNPKVAAALTGKVISAETKAKRSAAMKTYWAKKKNACNSI